MFRWWLNKNCKESSHDFIKFCFPYRHLAVKFWPESSKCLTTYPWPLKNHVQVVWSSVSSFNFYYLLFSLGSTSSCLHLLSRLPATFIFASIKCFGREVLCTMYQIKLSCFFIYVGCLFSHWLFLTILHFSHDPSNWSSPSFFSITLHSLKCSCDLPSQVFKFQHRQNCAKSVAFY